MIAFVFPGQGSQKTGMGQDLCRASEAAARLVGAASAVAGIDLLALDEAALAQTRYAQLAIVAHSLAAHAALKAALPAALAEAPAAFAGFSLGEYSAFTAAGQLTLEETMRLVTRRAELMQEASAARPGAMSAVLGLPAEAFEAILSRPPFAGRVFAVNDNAPGQMVIAGEAEAVAEAAGPLKEAGARRIVPLAVSGAFHTSLMAPAAAPLTEFARGFAFRPGSGPVYSNRTAEPLPASIDMPVYLAEHMQSPVLWRQEVARLVAGGCTAFVECGTGKVLAGLIRKIAPDVPVWAVEDAATLQAAIEGLTALKA